MKGSKILFWITVCGFVLLGSCAYFNAVVLIWQSTGPMMHAEPRPNCFLDGSQWFLGCLLSSGMVVGMIRGPICQTSNPA
jgi:hypothetical protein